MTFSVYMFEFPTVKICFRFELKLTSRGNRGFREIQGTGVTKIETINKVEITNQESTINLDFSASHKLCDIYWD